MTLADWVGIPYNEQDCNCWDIVRQFALVELGKEYPRYLFDVDTLMDDSEEWIKREQSALGDRWVEVDQPDVGDVIIFRIRGRATHIGIYVGYNNFLHSLRGRESTIEDLNGYWSQSVVGYYRWIGS
jgi:cell wall-associated NlpC family hydrolase